MKTIKIFGLLLLTVSLLLMESCSKKELDKINSNLNNPLDVPAKFTLTDVMTSTAFNVVGSDISLYASVYIEHEQGVWNQMYNAEKRTGEPVASTTYNNSWVSIYNNIKALKIVITKTSEGGEEEGNDVTCGIAKVLLAYNLGVLTDIFGDVPFAETGIMNEDGSPKYMQPQIDKQSDLYPQIQTLLDDAITLLQGSDDALTGSIGSQDLIYGGNNDKWTKAAYGLKARYMMHTLKISTDVEGDLTKVLDYVSKSFTGPAEELKYTSYDGDIDNPVNINPLFGISYARDMLGVSKSLAQKFKDLNDPRGDQAFMSYDWKQISLDDAIDQAADNGDPAQKQYEYPISMAEYAPTAPTMLLSYHEIMFLKAEALIRLTQPEDAKAALEQGIIAAFANLQNTIESTINGSGVKGSVDLSETVATDYFTNEVSERFDADPLKETMLQKYLAFYGGSGEATEAYNDYRRLKALGEDGFIALENPQNASKFPLRFTYGNSDVLANPNVSSAYGDGSYVYTENVWWAGGTR